MEMRRASAGRRGTSPALIALAVLALAVLAWGREAAAGNDEFWDGVWFECENAGRTTPPEDGCAMLDDDGLVFADGDVSHIKVVGSEEAEGCRKQQPGQCFRADEPRVSAAVDPSGAQETLSTWFLRKAEFGREQLRLRFLGCTQIYHVSSIGGVVVEARPDEDRCIWAQKKRFYMRRYQGDISFVE